MASTTSKETEIKLTNVARASLEELLIDYLDFLRVRNIPKWGASHSRYKALREYTMKGDLAKDLPVLLPRMDSEEMANFAITLIYQASHMLKRLIDVQQNQFVVQGGIREQMSRARLAQRNNMK